MSNNRDSVRIQQEMTAGRKSNLDLYSDLIVGKRGILAILKYELVNMICANLNGVLGLIVRRQLYPLLLKKCGRGVCFGKNVVLRHPNKIEIGDGVIIDDNCLIDAKGPSNRGIQIGDGVFLGRNSILSCKNGDIILGRKVNIGFNSEIFSGSRVELGENTLVAAFCYFIGGDHVADTGDRAINEQGSSSLGITVAPGCWFGAAVKVLDGVSIGANAILGAGAVVTKDVPENTVSVGVPARVIKHRGEGAERS